MTEIELRLLNVLLEKLQKDGFTMRADVIEALKSTQNITLKNFQYSLTKPLPSEPEKETFSIIVEIDL